MPIKIEPAAAGHLQEIRRISQESSPDPWSMATFHLFVEAGERLYVAVRGEQILGYVAFRPLIRSEAELLGIVVDKAEQGRGVGRFLLNYALSICKARGAEKIFLEVRAGNTSAQALYLAHGFLQTGSRKNYYKNPIEDAILMEKTL